MLLVWLLLTWLYLFCLFCLFHLFVSGLYITICFICLYLLLSNFFWFVCFYLLYLFSSVYCRFYLFDLFVSACICFICFNLFLSAFIPPHLIIQQRLIELKTYSRMTMGVIKPGPQSRVSLDLSFQRKASTSPITTSLGTKLFWSFSYQVLVPERAIFFTLNPCYLSVFGHFHHRNHHFHYQNQFCNMR